MSNKESQIKEWLDRPVQVGDRINATIKYTKKETVTAGRGKSRKVDTVEKEHTKHVSGIVKAIVADAYDRPVYAVDSYGWSVPYEAMLEMPIATRDTEYLLAEWCTPDVGHCGANPFRKDPPRINFYNQSVWQLMFNCGYDRGGEDPTKPQYKSITGRHPNDAPYKGMTTGGVNFDPYVIDADGNRQYYQRGLVWSTEQKQLLIESIYNGIEIGKFVLRRKSWEDMIVQMKETTHGFDFDCVDGKQRLNAIIDFYTNKFPDLHGNYYRDLSGKAQRRFLDYRNLALGTLEENSTDADAIDVFLTLNFTGVPMSAEHIEHVKSISKKL